MGGHGGLNILPQKSWNVYNYENREKVRRDEEAAAKEEQLKRDESRKRDAEFRLETLRQVRGIHAPRPQSPSPSPDRHPNSNSKHINLFEGLKTFPFSGRPEDDVQEDGPKKQKRQRRNDAASAAAPKVVLPEDEKYRLGYGIAGKGVKAPWYLSRPLACDDGNRGSATAPQQAESSRKASGKKTVEELREERMKREKQEKERERSLLSERKKRDRASARLR